MTVGSPARVLIVDDEASLLQLMQRFVSHLGYEVDTSSSGEDAWREFSVDPLRYKLVIADLTMPDMPGEELLRKMLSVHPSLRILVCSGYPINRESYAALSPEQIGFLQKPFVPKMLIEAIERLMSVPS
jgi:DNA-binding NtrC family response regulator